MGSRKKVRKISPERPPFEISLPSSSEESESLSAPDAVDLGVSGTGAAESDGPDSPGWRKSWYGRGWPQAHKAAPVTQVARESISAASGVASDLVSSARSRRTTSGSARTPSFYMSRGMGGSSRSLPAVATTTKLNIISNATIQPHDSAESGQHAEPEQRSTTTNSGKIPGIGEEAKSAEALAKFEPTSQDVATGVQPAPQHPDSVVFQSAGPMTDQSSWLGWFSKNGSRPAAENSPQLQDSARDACQPSLDKPSQVEDHEPAAQQSKPKGIDPDLLSRSGTAKSSSQAKSWFSLWNSAAAVGDMVHPVLAPAMPKPPAPVVVPHEETLPKQVEVQAKDQTNEMQNAATPTTSAVRVPGWAFWSRDNTKTPGESQASRAETGELAVADTPSQISPKAATVEGVARLGKRERPKSPDIKDQASSGSEPGLKTKFASGATTSKTGLTELVAAKSLQESSPNLVLPLFECTYRRQETHTLLQQLGSLLRYKKSTVNRHVQIDRDPPRIKRALAIGVHGYFPAPLIRTVLGQPTGTSIRFATSAATAIDTWTKSHGYSCEIEKIALEGEGKISERVDLLWKLLLNWLEVIRKADFILLACHSQGVPVTMMLIGKLIALGCVDSARIGVCAMAGVNLGPFGDYKSRWIGGSAGELFDFARPDSSVSKDYVAALEKNLRFGVRIVYIGSIDDQLVSLESSTFGTISHPYIYRAVFVDGRVHAPDFITHLVGFALRLRNLGISDHGLIRELSSPLAGSLYGGEGHSRIYEDESVYYLAATQALETTSVGDVALQIHRPGLSSTQNPYILPFAMRGVLEEDYVRTELCDETKELLRQFDDWKPSSKVLRDVKFRLEGVRSKL